ncbi:hypothetical protein TSUD_149200 [Trifolium subterraneum]|uniref:Uncharacterized protein n=1 Tax=Trifolium subterraneum TaxID=3900 RepID=A0A2Z6MZJ4_TRISU|nr:hypothetical protein TSUD_149200 [Trifolium subterraneum]
MAKKELASLIGPNGIVHQPPQPPLLPAAATGSSYFSFGSSAQQKHEIFNINGNNNNNSFSSFQMNPFQNQLMISSSSLPQRQTHNQFFSKKMLKEERENLD